MNICQSCGMPLDKETNMGTNKDKSKSKEYCVYCYKDGKFTDEGISMEDKIEKNINIAVQMGFSKEKAENMANKVIPTLKRWKK